VLPFFFPSRETEGGIVRYIVDESKASPILSLRIAGTVYATFKHGNARKIEKAGFKAV